MDNETAFKFRNVTIVWPGSFKHVIKWDYVTKKAASVLEFLETYEYADLLADLTFMHVDCLDCSITINLHCDPSNPYVW